MQIITADPTRMIELPGVGPCPRPVDIDESVTGFRTLKSLRIYRFASGVTIEGESESDEVYVIPIGGAVAMRITGAQPLDARLSDDTPRALYMTPDHAYRLTPEADVQVAYARAAAQGRVATHVVAGRRGTGAEMLAFELADLSGGQALASDATKERLIHVIDGTIRVADQTVAAPSTAALAAGEAAEIAAKGSARVLLVSA